MKNLLSILLLSAFGTLIVACNGGGGGSSGGGGNMVTPSLYSESYSSGGQTYKLNGVNNQFLLTSLESQQIAFTLTNTSSGASSISQTVNFAIQANNGTTANLPKISPSSCLFESSTSTLATCVINISQSNNSAGNSYNIIPTPVGAQTLVPDVVSYAAPINTTMNLNGTWRVTGYDLYVDNCTPIPIHDDRISIISGNNAELYINGQLISSGNVVNPISFPYNDSTSNDHGTSYYVNDNTIMSVWTPNCSTGWSATNYMARIKN